MKEVQYLLDVLEELKENAGQVDEREVEEMAAAILRAKRVYVAGAGRSGFAGTHGIFCGGAHDARHR